MRVGRFHLRLHFLFSFLLQTSRPSNVRVLQLRERYMDKQIPWIVCLLYFFVMINGRKDRPMVGQCPHVQNDRSVVALDRFRIPLDPVPIPRTSYGLTDGHERIVYLKIIDEEFIPLTLFALKHLKQLVIENTCFQPCHRHEIPVNIQCLAQSLTELYITNTNITRLPPQIGQLTKLQVLKLSNTSLRHLPATIGRLSSLTNLHLPNNHLRILPGTMQSLRSLKHITLTDNHGLRSIEPLNGLPSLLSVKAENCFIEEIPRDLPQLTHLFLANNSLTHLEQISTLGRNNSESKSFYFQDNQITHIPIDINRVIHLERLKLNGNNLTILTQQIFRIPTLLYLNIQCNDIEQDRLEKYKVEFNLRNPELNFHYHCP